MAIIGSNFSKNTYFVPTISTPTYGENPSLTNSSPINPVLIGQSEQIRAIAQLFSKSENEPQGLQEAKKLPKDFLDKIYEALWIIRGKPMPGNPIADDHFGEASFWNTKPHCNSSSQQKAAAIEMVYPIIEIKQALKNNAFNKNNPTLAWLLFEKMPDYAKNAIFRLHWELMGRPNRESADEMMRKIAHDDFGRVSFLGLEERCNTTNEQKLKTLDAFLAIIDKAQSGVNIAQNGWSNSSESVKRLSLFTLVETIAQLFNPGVKIEEPVIKNHSIEAKAAAYVEKYLFIKLFMQQLIPHLRLANNPSSLPVSVNSPSQPQFTLTSHLNMIPSQLQQNLYYPNKIFAYKTLTKGRSVGDAPITMQKWIMNNKGSLESLPLFSASKTISTALKGPFLYDASTSNTIHWTANFADSNLFGYCGGPLLAQDELQVLEHPGLAHLKCGMNPSQASLKPYEAALFQNVLRLGSLDTSTPLLSGQTLYGNNFAVASEAQIQSRLTCFNNPTSSNIFAIAAPHIPSALFNQPYQKKDIDLLFFTAYNAFNGIKATCDGKKTIVHSGNWGAGAFGNDPKTVYLLQLAAARRARIDEIRMYPMGQESTFQAAKQLLEQIEQQHPNMTIGEFLGHLTAHAGAYGLTYKMGNGT